MNRNEKNTSEKKTEEKFVIFIFGRDPLVRKRRPVGLTRADRTGTPRIFVYLKEVRSLLLLLLISDVT